MVRIRDAKLSRRMQIDSELDLEKDKTMVRQAEAIQEQQSALNPPAAAVEDLRISWW